MNNNYDYIVDCVQWEGEHLHRVYDNKEDKHVYFKNMKDAYDYIEHGERVVPWYDNGEVK